MALYVLTPHVQATTALPGFQRGGSVHSQLAASRAVRLSSVLISMRQAKMRRFVQLIAPWPEAIRAGPPRFGSRSLAIRLRT